MAKSLPDILYLRDKVTPVLDSPVSSYQIPYNKTAEYFANWQSYNQFVKSCEQVVRTNKRYKAYIAHLKNEVKFALLSTSIQKIRLSLCTRNFTHTDKRESRQASITVSKKL